MKVFLCVTAMQLASYAAQGAEVRDPEVVAQRFVEAWNAHAPSIFIAALDSDADWVHARGAKLRGRVEIESYLAQEHSTWAKETRMTPLGIESRLLVTSGRASQSVAGTAEQRDAGYARKARA